MAGREFARLDVVRYQCSLNGKHVPGFVQNANVYLTLSREGVAKAFVADLSPKEQELVYAVQEPAFQKVFSDVGVNAAWKSKPSWYVVASEDNAINPERKNG